MKSTIKLFLIVTLFVSTAFADGDMGSGGFAEGNMGNGAKTCAINCLTDNQTNESTDEDSNSTESDKSVLIIIQDYLNIIFG